MLVNRRPVPPPCRAFAALAALLLLAAGRCSGPTEDEVRTRVTRWLSPGATLAYTQRPECTAAAFKARTLAIKASLRVETDPNIALWHLEREGVVGLSVPGMTPTRATEIIASADFPTAVSVIRLGGTAQPCMAADFQNALYIAVNDPETVMILDTSGVTLLALDRTRRRIFYIKGAE